MCQHKGQINFCVAGPRKCPNHGSFKLENNEEVKHKRP